MMVALKLAVVEVFTPWKLANATIGLCPSTGSRLLSISYTTASGLACISWVLTLPSPISYIHTLYVATYNVGHQITSLAPVLCPSEPYLLSDIWQSRPAMFLL